MLGVLLCSFSLDSEEKERYVFFQKQQTIHTKFFLGPKNPQNGFGQSTVECNSMARYTVE